MYTRFFGLREKPFSITPDPRYLYMSQRHADALAHLIYGISQSGGFIQLTGEVGTGKTTLVRTLFEQLPEEADVALILNPELTTRGFLIAISEELGVVVPPAPSTKALIDGLNAHLLEAHARGRRTVLIVDEAQNLGTDVLEQIRLLTNLETPKQKLLQIILIGQPELRKVLSREDMRQLAQRVTGRYHLEPLSRADTARYIAHRMKVAGAAGEIFRPGAVREIYRRSKGVPRLINVVADRALLAGYTRDSRSIDRRVVRRAAAEVYGERRAPSWRRRLAGAAALGVMTLLAVGAGLRLAMEPEPASQAAPAAASAGGGTAALAVADLGTGEPGARPLGALLADPALAKDTDTAFTTLFALWGADYRPGEIAACEQAQAQRLRCWFQKGSISHVRRLNRPAILSLIGSAGEPYQIVVAALDESTASLAIGDQTHEVSLAELARYWYGDHLMLWKPGSELGNELMPGMHDESVRWLRESLARIRGEADTDTGATPEFYDAGLEARVREYQRDRRLTVDGIVGTQTQIVINTDLEVPGTPLLSRTR